MFKKKMFWFILILGIFLSLLVIFIISNSKATVNRLNKLLETNVLEKEDVVACSGEFDIWRLAQNYYAIELEITNDKLNSIITHLEESSETPECAPFYDYENNAVKWIESEKFTKDLTMSDAEHQFLTRVPINPSLMYFQSVYSHFYVYDVDQNTSYVCIRLYCI